MTLLVKLGGLGLLSHVECAPHAYAAAAAEADFELGRILGKIRPNSIEGDKPPAGVAEGALFRGLDCSTGYVI